MANRVVIERDVVVCVVDGDQTISSIRAMGDDIANKLAELEKQHKPRLAIDDIRSIGKVPKEGQRQVVAFEKSLRYRKLAMVGKGGMLRMGANLLIRASGRNKKLRYFTDYEAALRWLKEPE